MRLWVTRTEPQAQATAARLRELGHEAVVQPVLEVRALKQASLDLEGAGALAFTSQNGVEAFAKLSGRRDLAVFATGEATAQAALAAGFSAVEAAGGDVEALAALIIERRPAGPVVWPSPVEPAGDLRGLLSKAGVQSRWTPVYETVEVGAGAPDAIDGVLIHSAKAARLVAGRLSASAASGLALFAISAAAAKPLESLSFARIAVAAAPTEEALLALLA